MSLMTFSPEVERALRDAGQLFEDVPEPLLRAVAQVESSGDPSVTNSRTGAQGLMQFMPKTWGDWGMGGDPYDAHDAAHAAARYLHWLLRQFGGVLAPALASYNWGIGNVRALGVTDTAALVERVPEETADYMLSIVELLGGAGYQQPAPGPPGIVTAYNASRGAGLPLLVLAAVLLAVSSREG